MAKLAPILGLSLLWAQMLPPWWGPQAFHTRAEIAHFYGAQSWARQQDLSFMARVPLPLPATPPSPLPELWEKYALFDLLRESTPTKLSTYAAKEKPSYRAALALFYAAKYAFLRKEYATASEYLSQLQALSFPKALRDEMRFIKGYSAYATGKKAEALQELRPLAEKLGPFHDAANYYVGLIYYEKGDWRTAATHLEAVQTRPPYAQEAPLWLAYALAQLPDIPRLWEWCQRWATQEIAHKDTLWPFVGVQFARIGECVQAAYAAQHGASPLLQLWQGLCAYKANQDSVALLHWEGLLGHEDSIGYWARYSSAMALRRQKRLEEALALLRGIPIQVLPPGPEALWLKAQIAWELHLVEAGREALTTLLRLPLPEKKTAFRWLAEFYALGGQYQEAFFTLDSLPASEAAEPRQRFYLQMGFTAFAQKEYATAESLFTRAAQIEGPHTLIANFWRAEALYRKGALSEATVAYKTLLTHPHISESSYGAEARLALAWAYLQQNLPEEALRYSEPLRKNGPKTLRAYATFVSAGALYLKKKYAEALSLYERLFQEGELPVTQVRYYMAQTLLRLERYKEAEAVLSAIDPAALGADAALYLRAEVCAVWLARPECVREAAEALLRYHPTSSWRALAVARLGLALAELGEKEKAISTLENLLNEGVPPAEAARLALEGLRELLPADRYDAVYQAFLRRLPAESETRLSFERQRLRQLADGSRWEALKKEAFLLRTRYPRLTTEALASEALAAENLKDTAEALRLYQELTRYPEGAAQAWERLSRLHQAQGNLSLAWAAQESLLTRLPPSGYPWVQGTLTWAELAASSGRADTAVQVLRFLLADTSANPFLQQKLRLTLGLLYESLGKNDSALLFIRQAAQGDKNALTAEALYHEARLYYQVGQYNEARAAIYRLRDELPAYLEARAKAYLILARIFLAENKRKSARQLLESLIENAPTDALRAKAQALRDSIPPEPPPQEKPSKKKSKRPTPSKQAKP
ncbi:MAG: hypothetical protein KatS3mg025_0258 [Bacteroidia bacterium]|nr:MAG: hypothetical protein KatS3mg025_0258 [Bacteroidia bacterium]